MAKTQTDYINKIKAIKTGYLDGLWVSGDLCYEESGIWHNNLNAAMLASSAILAGLGEATADDISRAVSLVDTFFGANSYNVGGDGTWRASLNNASGYQNLHEALDQPVAEAMYYAWKYRVALGLSAPQTTKIVNALTVDETTTTIYGGHTLAIGTVKDNQNFSKWYLNRLTYGKLVLGDTTFDSAISTALKDFVYYMNNNFGTPNTGSNTLTGVFDDYGWRYIEALTWPTFEYGAMCLGGSLIFYPEISTAAALTTGEINLMKALERRLLGQWTHSGYPNWDTIWSYARIHVLQYWIWSARMLIGIARNGGLNQGAEDYKYARYLLDQMIDLHTAMDTWNSDASDGAVAKDPYGLTHTLATAALENQTINKAIGNAKFASELAICVEMGIPAVTSTAPGNIWSYGQTDKAIHISTPTYSACSLPSAPVGDHPTWYGADYVQCQNWGVSRIAAGSGRILTGFGGYGQEAFSLEIFEATTKVFSTSSTSNTQPAVQRVNVDDADIEKRTAYMTTVIPLTFTSKIAQTCKTSGAGNYYVQLDTIFYADFIRARYIVSRLSGTGAIDIIASIPLRKTAIVEYYDLSLNKTTLWNRPTLTDGGSPAPSACKYIHAKWATWNQGLLIVPRRARVLSGAVATVSASDPSTYSYRQPDQDRSVLLYLANDSTDLFQSHITIDFIITDGTDNDAEVKFASLPTLPTISSTEVHTWL